MNDDVVYLHAAVEGVWEGQPFRKNHVRAYRPIEIDGQGWRAISWTTAASAVADDVHLVFYWEAARREAGLSADAPIGALQSVMNAATGASGGESKRHAHAST